MARKKKRKVPQEPNAELLPPNKALSLLSTDPAAYTGQLGDPTAGADPAAGSVSDQPQTITRDDTQTASSQS